MASTEVEPVGTGTSGRAGGILLAVASMTCIQLGAALSEPLFDSLGPAGSVFVRLTVAALVLWAIARPTLRGRSAADLRAAAALGVCSGLLTLSFFEAIARIPLGVAVTIEFLGPLGVALAGSRRPRDVLWVVLAGTGVALLTLGEGAGEPLDVVGVLFAGIAAAGWAGYIVLTKHVGARFAGLDGLAISMAVAALVSAPFGIAVAGSALLEPELLLQGAALALLLPLLPYVFELIALRRLPTALFGVIMSLEPAIGAMWGYLLLDQGLTSAGIAAIGLVVLASAGATLTAREPSLPGAKDHAPAHGC